MTVFVPALLFFFSYAPVGQMSQTVCDPLSLFVFGHVLFVLARDAQLTGQTSKAVRHTFTPRQQLQQ